MTSLNMSPVSFLFGCFVVFTVPASCCREKEYQTSDGQCCPMCYEGTFVRRDCTPHGGTRCDHCENGTFMNRPNGYNKCFPCTSCVSADGLFVKQACTARTDTVCDVLSGYMCRSESDSTGCSLADKHSRCAAGQQIKEIGTRESNTVCEDCQHGYFSKDGVKCLAWKNCSKPDNVVRRGDSHNDVICRESLRSHGLSYHDYPPLVIFVLQLLYVPFLPLYLIF